MLDRFKGFRPFRSGGNEAATMRRGEASQPALGSASQAVQGASVQGAGMAASADGAPRKLQPLLPASDVGEEEMQGLCKRVAQMIEEGGGGAFSPMAASSSAGGGVQQWLRYQVVVSRGGAGGGDGASATASVVGCMPLDRPSAAAYQWLPLSAAVRSHQEPLPHLPAFGGGGGAADQAAADLSQDNIKGGKRKPATAAGYKPARFSAPRESGMVVLHAEVELGSGRESSGGGLATGAEQQQGGGGRGVEVRVRPWCDRDSVEAWMSQVRSGRAEGERVAEVWRSACGNVASGMCGSVR